MIKSRVKLKHFSVVGLMSPGWVRTQVRTHSDFCWTRGLGLWSNRLGLGLWSNGLGLTPDGLGLWPDGLGLGLGLGLWPCGLELTVGLTSPDSLQHWYKQNLSLKKPPGQLRDKTGDRVQIPIDLIVVNSKPAFALIINWFRKCLTDFEVLSEFSTAFQRRGHWYEQNDQRMFCFVVRYKWLPCLVK